MNRTTYHPRRPTVSEKAATMSFYQPAADDLPADPVECAVAAMASPSRKRGPDPEYTRMQSAEMQAVLTEDNLRALREAPIPANPNVEAVDPTRWPAKPTWTPARQPVEPTVAPEAYAPSADQRRVSDAAAFALGGNAIFTVVSRKSGTRFTYRVRRPREDSPWFVSVLTGPDNETGYTYLGTLFADGTYRHGRKSSIGETAPSAIAAKWFFSNLNNPDAMAKCEVWHEGRCCRCGRRLTVPSSIEAGIGPECAGKA